MRRVPSSKPGGCVLPASQGALPPLISASTSMRSRSNTETARLWKASSWIMRTSLSSTLKSSRATSSASSPMADSLSTKRWSTLPNCSMSVRSAATSFLPSTLAPRERDPSVSITFFFVCSAARSAVLRADASSIRSSRRTSATSGSTNSSRSSSARPFSTCSTRTAFALPACRACSRFAASSSRNASSTSPANASCCSFDNMSSGEPAVRHTRSRSVACCTRSAMFLLIASCTFCASASPCAAFSSTISINCLSILS
mmetsp:Transcript_14673/g.39283  ORF Transcript_14673/g.39283 Transcript_14673/m.39283 type:complete len:258 (-) Transcript_14673:416-1189(-)